jgi:outer membrane protein OmpA-like peptidoglycan-associated protein
MPGRFLFILFLFTAFIAGAQNSNTLRVGICVLDASNLYHVIDARILICELNEDSSVIKVDTLHSNIYVNKEMQYPHLYRIIIEKSEFYILDTTFLLQKTSRSQRKRLGLLMHPVNCFTLKGRVKNADTYQGIKQGKVYVEDLSDSSKTILNLQNGSFEYCGRCSTSYRIITDIAGYFPSRQRVELLSPDCKKKKDLQQNLIIAVAESYDTPFFEGDTLSLNDFTFEGESAKFTKKGRIEIKRLIRVLTARPEISISILIQAATFSDRRYNRRLAEQRARVIDALLIREGVGPHRYLLKCSGKMDRKSRYSKQKISLWLRG